MRIVNTSGLYKAWDAVRYRKSQHKELAQTCGLTLEPSLQSKQSQCLVLFRDRTFDCRNFILWGHDLVSLGGKYSSGRLLRQAELPLLNRTQKTLRLLRSTLFEVFLLVGVGTDIVQFPIARI